MVHYRRSSQPRGTFFFTVALLDRSDDLLTRKVDVLRQAFEAEHARRPFEVVAVVVLPEHLHAVWRLPAGDGDYAARWRSIKSRFVRALNTIDGEVQFNRRGEANVWQRRYWEHAIRDDSDLQRHVDYIHFNPVKHGYVRRVRDWPYSSFHRYVRRGLLPMDWAGEVEAVGSMPFGEPRTDR